jgi:hypothetical protein
LTDAELSVAYWFNPPGIDASGEVRMRDQVVIQRPFLHPHLWANFRGEHPENIFPGFSPDCWCMFLQRSAASSQSLRPSEKQKSLIL